VRGSRLSNRYCHDRVEFAAPAETAGDRRPVRAPGDDIAPGGPAQARLRSLLSHAERDDAHLVFNVHEGWASLCATWLVPALVVAGLAWIGVVIL